MAVMMVMNLIPSKVKMLLDTKGRDRFHWQGKMPLLIEYGNNLNILNSLRD